MKKQAAPTMTQEELIAALEAPTTQPKPKKAKQPKKSKPAAPAAMGGAGGPYEAIAEARAALEAAKKKRAEAQTSVPVKTETMSMAHWMSLANAHNATVKKELDDEDPCNPDDC